MAVFAKDSSCAPIRQPIMAHSSEEEGFWASEFGTASVTRAGEQPDRGPNKWAPEQA